MLHIWNCIAWTGSLLKQDLYIVDQRPTRIRSFKTSSVSLSYLAWSESPASHPSQSVCHTWPGLSPQPPTLHSLFAVPGLVSVPWLPPSTVCLPYLAWSQSPASHPSQYVCHTWPGLNPQPPTLHGLFAVPGLVLVPRLPPCMVYLLYLAWSYSQASHPPQSVCHTLPGFSLQPPTLQCIYCTWPGLLR